MSKFDFHYWNCSKKSQLYFKDIFVIMKTQNFFKIQKQNEPTCNNYWNKRLLGNIAQTVIVHIAA